MILNENVKLKLTKGNISYYKKLFPNNIVGEEVKIPIEKLSKGSSLKVKVKCEICGKEKLLSYKKYLNNKSKQNFYACSTCSIIKRENTCLEKYGFKNPVLNKEIQEKISQKKKENYLNNKNEIIEKYKETSLNNYGVDNPSKSLIIKEKIKENRNKTTIKNYFKKGINIIKIVGDYYHLYCSKCNKEFTILNSQLYNRYIANLPLCTNCNPIGSFKSSKYEIELLNYIETIYNGKIEKSSNIISPYEIDIYLPDLKIGFEFNGLYWHSLELKTDFYHKNKSDLCLNNNINLIHIWENNWMKNSNYIKNNLKRLINPKEINNFKIKDIGKKLILYKENNVISSIKYNNELLYDYENYSNFVCLKHFISYININKILIDRDFIDKEDLNLKIKKYLEPEQEIINSNKIKRSGKIIFKNI